MFLSSGRPQARRAAVLITSLLVAIGVAACGGDDKKSGTASSGGAPKGGGTIKVGVMGPVSGPAGPLYPPSKQAAELAVEEINAAGGVLGNKLEIVTADSASTPATAQREARRLLNDDVKVIVHGDTTADRDGAIASAKRSDVPYFYTFAAEGGPLDGGEADVCHPNVWLTGQVPSNWWPEPFKWLVEDEGWDRWFMIGNDYSFHQAAFPRVGKIVEASGGKVEGMELVPLGTTNYGTSISKMKRLPKDTAIVNVLVGNDMNAFLKQWEQAGGSNEKMVSFDLVENQAAALGKTAANIRGIYDYYHTLDTPGNKKFIAALQKKYGADAQLQSSLSNETYEALWIWALATNKAGSHDLAKFSKAITEVTHDGPRGPVKFDKNHLIPLSSVIGRLGNDGLYKIEKTFPKVAGKSQCELSTFEVK
jgi:ABC-type branched-subunit amino acid transport system substrate-binding protein